MIANVVCGIGISVVIELQRHIGVDVGIEDCSVAGIDTESRREVELLRTADAVNSIKVGSGPTTNGVICAVEMSYQSCSCCQNSRHITRSSYPTAVSEKVTQSVILRQGAIFKINVEDQSTRASHALAGLHIPKIWQIAFNAVGAIPKGMCRGTGSHVAGSSRYGWSTHQGIVVGIRIIGVMGHQFTEMFREMQLISSGTVHANTHLHVEDRCRRDTLDAMRSVEERTRYRAIVNRSVEQATLIVLVN